MENNIDILNEIDRQETEYTGVYLGSREQVKKSNPNEFYGIISLYFKGVNKQGTPWYSVQDQYFSVEVMKKLVKDIPFGVEVKATYSCGNTPGGKQKIVRLEQI